MISLFFILLSKPSFAFGLHKKCPIDWSDSRHLEIRRCFRTSGFKFKCDHEPDNKNNPFGELEIEAKFSDGLIYIYGYGKMIGLDVCQNHEHYINKIIHNQSQVCVTTTNGESKLSDGSIYARWSSVETANGCVLR